MSEKNLQKDSYDLIIVGGGIVGTAILFVASRYANLRRIALFEKNENFAEVNSNRGNNSQTLHTGDIETNYTLEKALRVKSEAEFLKNYLERFAPPGAFRKMQKMVLAVGARETEALEKRFEIFKNDYPDLRMLRGREIEVVEPKLIEGRDSGEPLLALAAEGYAVDFGAVAVSFVQQSKQANYPPDIFLNAGISNIKRTDDVYEIKTSRGRFFAKTIVVAAGPQSLVFAKQLGYGKNFGILPVAGNFYGAKNILRGKVYMMQIPGMPFAAIHGDPDINNPSETRFGPTIRVLPVLERHRYRTMKGFLRTSAWNLSGITSLIYITFNPVIFRYALKNLFYDIPFVGKSLFVRWELQKIVPSFRPRDVTFLRGKGGIRPQVVNIEKQELEFGEAEITGERIIFSVTPSPGASVCLAYAGNAVQKIVDFLGNGAQFDRRSFEKDLA